MQYDAPGLTLHMLLYYSVCQRDTKFLAPVLLITIASGQQSLGR